MSFLDRYFDGGSPSKSSARVTTERTAATRTEARQAAERVGALSGIGKKPAQQ
ncbi:hypothetical protein OOK44_36380 [Streptomyces cellulosae]|uniref:Uncharacterized protein n=1 Tax=Streptomyces althioticus TaxID=83380 RepID=A0ABZ1YFY7_9ACTN|nr:hypothetical protein [Streptomyces cellulosae]WTB93482.1 hypothetical protein OIE99_35130 [Streptomyces cellulosae]WTC60873.1 hypothetical protein OH715_36880 [Streptomyces cellulosae]